MSKIGNIVTGGGIAMLVAAALQPPQGRNDMPASKLGLLAGGLAAIIIGVSLPKSPEGSP